MPEGLPSPRIVPQAVSSSVTFKKPPDPVVTYIASGYNQHMSWNLIGHEWAADILKKHIQKGNVSHAYLILRTGWYRKAQPGFALCPGINLPGG